LRARPIPIGKLRLDRHVDEDVGRVLDRLWDEAGSFRV
jgi:hypothetical protein